MIKISKRRPRVHLRRATGFAFLAILACLSIAALRHGIYLSAETTAARAVRLGAFFDSGDPMRGGTIALRRRDGTAVLDGKTNDEGYLVWSTPTPGHYIFTADDGTGHRGRQSFGLSAFQLDGSVRDLIEETGREPSLAEKIQALPRWLTALAGVSFIVAVFAVVAWRRTARELAALRQARS